MKNRPQTCRGVPVGLNRSGLRGPGSVVRGRWSRRGTTLLELLVATALAAGVVLIAGTLYLAVLGTERTTRELLGSTPEADVLGLLEDLSSCGGTPDYRVTSDGGFLWWRQAVCVRAYVLDVRGTGGGSYVLRFRQASDTAALRALRALAEGALSGGGSGGKGGEKPPPSGSVGWVEVRTANACACRADFTAEAPDASELAVVCTDPRGSGRPAACAPAPGPAEGRPVRYTFRPGPSPGPGKGADTFLWEVVVVPPGGRLPAEAPSVVSPQGLSVGFLVVPEARDVPPGEPFPGGVEWLPLYVHLPSPTLEAGVTLTAWGSRYFDRDPDLPGAVGLLTRDLDGDGDGELEADEAPARRFVPASAVEGWTLWTTGFGRLRKTVPVRCGPRVIPVGDTRECRSAAFRPF